MKKIFCNVFSHKSNRKNNRKSKATPSVQNLQISEGMLSNISVSSEPIRGTQANQESQSPRPSIQSASVVPSSAIHPIEAHKPIKETQGSQAVQHLGTSTQLESVAQSPEMNQNKKSQALHIAGSMFEKSLKTFKDFADLIPMAPGLGPALGVVCGCIEVYHVSGLLISVYRELANKLSKK